MWFPQYGAPLIQWYYYAIISPSLHSQKAKKSKHAVDMFSFKFVFYFVLYKR